MRMARNNGTDMSVLSAALLGYQAQRESILKKMEEIKALLGRKAGRVTVTAAPATRTHRISPEGLKRIREAQKRRWAAAKAKAAAA
jgi:hypothetical protein